MATKKVIEKKTGEKYASKAAMAKHEKKEGKAEQIKEYGKPKGPMQKKSPMKQTMGATGLGAGTKEGKYATQKVKQAAKAYVKFSKDLDRQADRGPATQLKSVAKKQIAVKKAPAKMKKC